MANNFEYFSPTKVLFGKKAEEETGRLEVRHSIPGIVRCCSESSFG